jgi:general secretion pathway protein B
MSLILDALRRSEAEDKGAPPLALIDDLPNNRSRLSQMLIGVLVGFLTLALLVMGFQWLGLGNWADIASSAAIDGEVDMMSRQTAIEITGVQVPQQKAPGLTAVLDASRRAEAVEPMSSIPIDESPQAPGLDAEKLAALNHAMWQDAEAALPKEAGQTSGSEAAALEAQGAVPAEQRRSEPSAVLPTRSGDASPIDLQEVMERLARDAGEVVLTPHPTPLLEALTQQQKDRVPTIIYTAHQFGANDSTFVELNGSRLREGESREGIRVVEILADSVILSVSDTQFRLKALNSWVNL